MACPADRQCETSALRQAIGLTHMRRSHLNENRARRVFDSAVKVPIFWLAGKQMLPLLTINRIYRPGHRLLVGCWRVSARWGDCRDLHGYRRLPLHPQLHWEEFGCSPIVSVREREEEVAEHVAEKTDTEEVVSDATAQAIVQTLGALQEFAARSAARHDRRTVLAGATGCGRSRGHGSACEIKRCGS